jgi:hypothetical protein
MNPGPILIIRNTFPTLARFFKNSSLIKSEIQKHIYFFCNHLKNPKTRLPYFFSFIIALVIYCITCILLHLLFYFTYIQHLVIHNHSVELGIQDKEIVLHFCLTKIKRASSTIPQEFDINPELSSWGNLLLLQHSALGVPTKWLIS